MRSKNLVTPSEPEPTLNFHPSQALCFGDLDFAADHLGQLHLCEGDAPPPQTPSQETASHVGGPTDVDPEALASRINAYLGLDLDLGQCQCTFNALANTFS